ncbi:ADP-ribosylglycohydrolase family protein [Kineosporia sp. A_224]|uniref:ADP-ribosylglycohydrolase family protein n=1 Tax=Kineosporia sp. A_224 TaxID=1962180 RepID=UPI000B4A73E3|nr:ADP-ribosylglycohydrolase family protein [Kineosporia sp. A_224]
MDASRHDRSLAALLGLAVGDALGMPTQELSRARAEQLLGAGPVLLDGPPDNPVCPGLAAGSVTDDTAQALLLGRLLVDGHGRIDPHDLADRLLGWEDAMAARGSLDLLGPSTKAALLAVRGGADPATTGRGGTTNGAAMRVAPVGVATPPEPLAGLVDAVVAAGQVTHDTGTAHAGAAAVAAVVAAGVDGAAFDAALPLAVRAAREAGRRGARPDDQDVAGRIEAALALVRSGARGSGRSAADGGSALLDAVATRVGTTLATHESVPAAFAVAALADGDPWRAAWFGARLGGDADTVAAMAGACVAACTGTAALPPDVVAQVVAVNTLDLAPLVEGLLALRAAR